MRRFRDLAFRTLVTVCGIACCSILAVILGTILSRGLPAISLRFLTEQIRLVGADGGIFYNVVGTLILIGTALLISTPLAIGTALVIGFYLRESRWKWRLTVLLYTLNGVPSLLFGLFGFIVFVKHLNWGKSWLVGGFLLGWMMLPTVAISLLERISNLPARYLEAAAALGLRPSRIVWAVVLPQSITGWVTGSFLGLARAAGETAPILFTATIFAGATYPTAIRESPVLSLPYHIFVLAQDSFDPAVGAKVWGTATVLLTLVFGLSLAALPARLKLHEEAARD